MQSFLRQNRGLQRCSPLFFYYDLRRIEILFTFGMLIIGENLKLVNGYQERVAAMRPSRFSQKLAPY